MARSTHRSKSHAARVCALSTWLSEAAAGETFAYHDGFLAVDSLDASCGGLTRERKRTLAVANLAWRASEQNLVHLVQRRMGPGRFAYLAVMRGPADSSRAGKALGRGDLINRHGDLKTGKSTCRKMLREAR